MFNVGRSMFSLFDLPAFALETLSLNCALFFSKVLSIAMTRNGVACGPARNALKPV
jgi:hypothetical protein